MTANILWCQACGASTALVDKTTHQRNCRAGPVTWTSNNPHKPSAAEPPPPAQSDMANDGMANVIHMANEGNTPGRNRASPTYRYRNPDKRRAYMAAYMRTYRKRADQARAA
jgi:hypothetical protein